MWGLITPRIVFRPSDGFRFKLWDCELESKVWLGTSRAGLVGLRRCAGVGGSGEKWLKDDRKPVHPKPCKAVDFGCKPP